MSKHYLAISHEPRDISIIFGVFGSFVEARDYLDAKAAEPDAYCSSKGACIEEWDGQEHMALWERKWDAPKAWEEVQW